ncbi:outer mitochondrial membrane protein porin [Tothia fuscella]|uniref:Outer mitochondrial membrane protein porin n=1 Tax=Tothia fuscella TaxID=1048955 RepID=A0A9P4U0D3_9PEZI|nr:outer mitochondrial membrane protein porin [Tothia fuscella]
MSATATTTSTRAPAAAPPTTTRPIVFKMPVPAFSDVAKPANDIINKDFYHNAAAILDVKLKAPDGLAVNAKGTSPHEGDISGSIEAKKSVAKGVTLTETWTTASFINTKLELVDVIAQGVKAEFMGVASTKQGLGLKGQKLSLYFTQGAFNARGFFDYNPTSGNVNATLDGVFGHEGFVVGGEAGYDVQKAALTKYSAAVGYSTPVYSGAVTATNNLSVFAASYYHKVNASVEAGVKAAYDTKSSSTVGLEIASKYRIDPTSFAKAKINDRGILQLAYNVKVNQGLTFGIGGSFDTQKLNEAGHKIGTSFTFEG